MRTSVHQAFTGVTPTLDVATLSVRTSASVTRALMETGMLALVGKSYLCACFTTNMAENLLNAVEHGSPSSFSLFADVDECLLNNGYCEHNCSNELGTYRCQCAAGYQLDQGGHNCTGNYFERKMLIRKEKKHTNKLLFLFLSSK